MISPRDKTTPGFVCSFQTVSYTHLDVYKRQKYSLVAITGPARMMVEGKVRYMSSGVTLADESTVVTSGDETVYIIFK